MFVSDFYFYIRLIKFYLFQIQIPRSNCTALESSVG